METNFTPVYFQPDTLRQEALSAIDRLCDLPDNMLLTPGMAVIGPDGKFVCETTSKNSMIGLMVRGVYKYSNLRGYGRNMDYREYSNAGQFVQAILGYSAMWLKDNNLVDADGNDIPAEQKYVLCPDTLNRLHNLGNTEFHSPDGIRTLLRNAPVVLLKGGAWENVMGTYTWCSLWKNHRGLHIEPVYNECTKCATDLALYGIKRGQANSTSVYQPVQQYANKS